MALAVAHERGDDHRVGHVAGLGRHLAGEARVLAALGHDDALAACDHGAGHPDARREAQADDLGRSGAPRRLVDELAAHGVGERDRAGRRVEHAGGGADDGLHHAPADRPVAEALGQRLAAPGGQRRADRLGEGRGRGDALLRQQLEPAGQRGAQIGVDPGRELLELGRVAVARRRADEQRPQRGGQAVDVAGGRDGPAGEHLGRHEARRADRDRALLLLAAERAGHAEVDEDHALVAQDHVGRLDVAVDDLLVVHVLQGLAPVAGELDAVPDGQARIAVALEHRAEVEALDELHDDVGALLVAGVVEDLDEPRMAQAGQQARLDLEARGVADVEQALDGDLAALLAVEGAVDGAHSAAGDGGDDLVTVGEGLPCNRLGLLLRRRHR